MQCEDFENSDHGCDTNEEAESCGGYEDISSQAADTLAAWFAEDMKAVATSFGVSPTKLLETMLERLRSDAARRGLRDGGS